MQRLRPLGAIWSLAWAGILNGAVSGALYAGIGGTILAMIDDGALFLPPLTLFLGLVGCVVGAIFGAMMGAFIGAVVAYELWQADWPPTDKQMIRIGRAGKVGLALATVGAYAIILLPIGPPPTVALLLYILVIPGIIAVWRLWHAQSRYIDSLMAEAAKPKPKRKATP